MRVFLSVFIICICFYQNAFASCSSVKRISIVEFVYQNDVIFIGQQREKADQTRPYTFIVEEVLKGSLFPKDKVKIEPYRRLTFAGQLSSIRSLKSDKRYEKDMFLIYARYNKDNILVEQRSSECTSLPTSQTIIWFMKGPYKYRYAFLFTVILLAYLIWRVGGLRNFLTKDLSAFPRLLMNSQILAEKRPIRYKKTAFIIFLILAFLFMILVFEGDSIFFSYFYNGGAF